MLFVERDSFNAISWVFSIEKGPWRLYFHFNEINYLVSTLHVPFQHVGRSTIGLVDVLAKQGISKTSPFNALIM